MEFTLYSPSNIYIYFFFLDMSIGSNTNVCIFSYFYYLKTATAEICVFILSTLNSPEVKFISE